VVKITCFKFSESKAKPFISRDTTTVLTIDNGRETAGGFE